MEHYWIRVDRNPNADLPDTKNLYGYRWSSNKPPQPLRDLTLAKVCIVFCRWQRSYDYL